MFFFKLAMLVCQRLCLLVSYRSGPENRCTRKFDGLEHYFPSEIVISWVFPIFRHTHMIINVIWSLFWLFFLETYRMFSVSLVAVFVGS